MCCNSFGNSWNQEIGIISIFTEILLTYLLTYRRLVGKRVDKSEDPCMAEPWIILALISSIEDLLPLICLVLSGRKIVSYPVVEIIR